MARSRRAWATIALAGLCAAAVAACAGAKPRIAGDGMALPAGAQAAIPSPPVTIPAERLAGQVPWMRTYLDPARLPDAAQKTLVDNCSSDSETGLLANRSTGPTIAVLGDSAVGTARGNALQDNQYRWAFASACDDTFRSVLDKGRVDKALSTDPAALVLFLGANDISAPDGKPQPAKVEAALGDLDRLLAATDKAKCRVILTLPEVTRPELGDAGGHADSAADGASRVELTRKINTALAAAASRPGVHVVDFNARVQAAPRYYIWDHMHPTSAGVNLLLNGIVEGAQPCLSAPPTPTDVEAVAEEADTFVVWNPSAGKSISYVVERSDGQLLKANKPQAILKETALADTSGEPLRFRVSAVSGVTASPWTDWVDVKDGLAQPAWLKALAVVVLMAGLVVALVLATALGSIVRARDRRRLIILDAALGAFLLGSLLLGLALLAIVAVLALAGANAWFFLLPPKDDGGDGSADEAGKVAELV